MAEIDNKKMWESLIRYGRKYQYFEDAIIDALKDQELKWNGKEIVSVEEETYPIKSVVFSEQKSSWSEEDTRLLDNCISLIEDIDCTKEEQNWLKGIKDRVQLKQEWSEEDVEMLQQVIADIEDLIAIETGIKFLANYHRHLNWLKSLKNKVQPQPKQEWSEEDDIMVHDIDYALRCQIAYPKPRLNSMSSWIYELKNRVQPKQEWSKEDKDYYDAIIAKLEVTQDDALLTDNQIIFLKSLKERYTWKPSDEQIIALRWVLNNIPYNKHKEEISGLLDQIKEL